ncbi:type VI secretion system-associated lipoprotein [Photobacterium proteolyticum]|uniref:Type VI secretion system-associated lipoprotein n=1 Tax=Photobacterium proteolyticum TaxID=1903952 RepID=A0A1Q9GEM1_9GAMM|nr:type VI secretion system lipoprotein TssJ [Photobacterium proteolyticum]OLQ72848.1 type VI secretion system-associated lipoprotein [Photobacterium proteolyticum]
MAKKLLILLSVFLISGCSYLTFWKDASPLQVIVNIEAANNINPNVDGLASPLEVRVYQLQDSEAFNQASFIDLYNDDQGVLKAGLLSKRNLDSVLPGEKRQVAIPLIAETEYIAVVAAFADFREAKNKVILQIQAGLPVVVDVKVDGVNVSITGQED